MSAGVTRIKRINADFIFFKESAVIRLIRVTLAPAVKVQVSEFYYSKGLNLLLFCQPDNRMRNLQAVA
ncbi:MAG: hypothetical protein ABIG63_04200, partial [Chloroflexota bacterium]